MATWWCWKWKKKQMLLRVPMKWFRDLTLCQASTKAEDNPVCMRKNAIISSLIYQQLSLLSWAQFLQRLNTLDFDMTYYENTDLPYLWNATAINNNVVRWVAVAWGRSNKDVDFYLVAFKAVFDQRKEDFSVCKSLKWIVLDGIDNERKGMQLAIGQDLCDKLLIGCQVHYGRSYQQVVDKVSNPLPCQIRSLSHEAFCAISRANERKIMSDETFQFTERHS